MTRFLTSTFKFPTAVAPKRFGQIRDHSHQFFGPGYPEGRLPDFPKKVQLLECRERMFKLRPKMIELLRPSGGMSTSYQQTFQLPEKETHVDKSLSHEPRAPIPSCRRICIEYSESRRIRDD